MRWLYIKINLENIASAIQILDLFFSLCCINRNWIQCAAVVCAQMCVGSVQTLCSIVRFRSVRFLPAHLASASSLLYSSPQFVHCACLSLAHWLSGCLSDPAASCQDRGKALSEDSSSLSYLFLFFFLTPSKLAHVVIFMTVTELCVSSFGICGVLFHFISNV